MPAKTKQEASRAISAGDLTYRGEFDVVNDVDVKSLADFAKTQVRKNAKLRIFVGERKEHRRP